MTLILRWIHSYSNVKRNVESSNIQVPLAMLYYYSSSSTKKDEKELRGSSPTEISSCQVKRRLLGRSVVPNTVYGSLGFNDMLLG